MPKHMFREIEKLKKKILYLSSLVEESVQKSFDCIDTRDEDLAQEVIEADEVINELEVEIEEDALKLLALYQPVASVLRFVVAAIKINNDLERIGDLATNISKRGINIARCPHVQIPYDFARFSTNALIMVKQSIDSLVNLSTESAKKVCESDSFVDEINRVAFQKVKEAIIADTENIDTYMQMNGVARNIERIADHATNIAEDVIYMQEGEIIRHSFNPNI